MKAVRIAAALAVALVTAAAQAVTLDKGFVAQPFLDTPLPGTTSAVRPELAGTVLVDDVQAFSFAGVSGTVQSRVVREDGAGTLDFYWRVIVDPVDGAIDAFRLGNFGYANIADADWRSDGLGTAAPFVGRVFNPAGRPDGAINFLFTDGVVGSGVSSRFFFLHTAATDYDKSASYDLLCVSTAANCISPQFATFAPAVPVPEPQTYALMLAGLGMVGWMARRRTAG